MESMGSMENQSSSDKDILTESKVETTVSQHYCTPTAITKRAFEEVEQMMKVKEARFNKERQNAQ